MTPRTVTAHGGEAAALPWHGVSCFVPEFT